MEGNCELSAWRVVVANCESSAWREVVANCVSSAWRIIVANCEFDGPEFVSMISRYVQLTLLRAEDTTHCSAKRLSRQLHSKWLSREKGGVCSVDICQGK